MVAVVQGVATALLPPDPVTTLLPVAAFDLVLTICSPACVHLDRRYVTAVSEWEPSGWYYWTILPPLTVALAPLSLLRRYQDVGVP